MSITAHNFDRLANEHVYLLKQYAKVQEYCTELAISHRKQIEQLQAEIMRLRADHMARDTALAWVQEDSGELDTILSEPPKKQVRYLKVLIARIQALLAMRSSCNKHCKLANTSLLSAKQEATQQDNALPEKILAASLHAADLVICQTGCISHNAYWRQDNYCKRTGQACMLVDHLKTVDLIHSLNSSTLIQSEYLSKPVNIL